MVGQGHSGQLAQTKGVESLLAFWAQVGVDVSLGDTPVNRLLQPERLKPAATATPIAGPIRVGAPVPDIDSAIAEAQAGDLEREWKADFPKVPLTRIGTLIVHTAGKNLESEHGFDHFA